MLSYFLISILATSFFSTILPTHAEKKFRKDIVAEQELPACKKMVDFLYDPEIMDDTPDLNSVWITPNYTHAYTALDTCKAEFTEKMDDLFSAAVITPKIWQLLLAWGTSTRNQLNIPTVSQKITARLQSKTLSTWFIYDAQLRELEKRIKNEGTDNLKCKTESGIQKGCPDIAPTLIDDITKIGKYAESALEFSAGAVGSVVTLPINFIAAVYSETNLFGTGDAKFGFDTNAFNNNFGGDTFDEASTITSAAVATRKNKFLAEIAHEREIAEKATAVAEKIAKKEINVAASVKSLQGLMTQVDALRNQINTLRQQSEALVGLFDKPVCKK